MSQLDLAIAHKDRGNRYLEEGLLDLAACEYGRALEICPDYHVALSNLGIVLQAQGQLPLAAERLTQALAIKPDFTPAMSNLGVVWQRLGRLDEAEAILRKALALEPDYAEARSNLGNVVLTLGRWDEAVMHYREALRRLPDFPDALANLGVALQQQGRLGEAVDCLERSLQLDSKNHETWTNLGVVRHRQGSLDVALSCLARALQLKPDHPDAMANLACLLVEQGRLDEAMMQFERALQIAPDLAEAHFAQGLLLLLQGNFAEGWGKHEWRWRRTGVLGHGRLEPMWDGKPLSGRRILLHCEQGLGDSIQFIRFAAAVKSKGGQVVLLCPPGLSRLFATVAGIDRIVTDGTQLPDCACQAPLMSLPLLLGITLENLSSRVPYVFPPESSLCFQTPRPGLQVGLVWRGNRSFKDDFKRSMDPHFLRPLLDIPGITFVGLQVDPREGDGEVFSGYSNYIDASSLLTDFAATAAMVSHLDLVIAVDTAVLHLAGALGRPAWALLPYTPDWRWLLGRSDSPWYPTLRLFRQQQRGDWLGVMAQVAAQLRALVAASE